MPEKRSYISGGVLIKAQSREHYSDAHKLFTEYAEGLGFDLCFQGFDKELKTLEIMYGEPEGCLLLYYIRNMPAGCVALRKLSGKTCEMKRLYVKPRFRGKKIGEYLTVDIIKRAREKKYKKMKLDTLGRMEAARSLYKNLGFVVVRPYRYNPVEDVVYMEKILL